MTHIDHPTLSKWPWYWEALWEMTTFGSFQVPPLTTYAQGFRVCVKSEWMEHRGKGMPFGRCFRPKKRSQNQERWRWKCVFLSTTPPPVLPPSHLLPLLPPPTSSPPSQPLLPSPAPPPACVREEKCDIYPTFIHASNVKPQSNVLCWIALPLIPVTPGEHEVGRSGQLRNKTRAHHSFLQASQEDSRVLNHVPNS